MHGIQKFFISILVGLIVTLISGISPSPLIGIDPTFCAHPEFTFRILANAIYHSLD